MMGCAEAIEERLRVETGSYVPVVDPVPAAMMQAISLVKLGMSHGKITYPNSPAKRISGYDFIDFSARNQVGKNTA